MRNRHLRTYVLSIVLAILVAPAPAAAQANPLAIAAGLRRVDLTGSRGLLLSTDWSDLVLLGSVSTVSGALEQVLVRDLVVDPGPMLDGVVTYWEGRYGFRVHGGFAESCLAVGRRCREAPPPSLGGEAGAVDVDEWMFDVGGAIGLVEYSPGKWVWPFVFAGVGAVTYNLERSVGPPLTFIERRPVAGTQRAIVVSENPEPLLIAVDELGLETKLALNVGLGTDIRIPLGAGSLGLRLEVSDYIHRSPLQVRIVDPSAFLGFASDSRLNFGNVHNMRAAAGLVVQFGR